MAVLPAAARRSHGDHAFCYNFVIRTFPRLSSLPSRGRTIVFLEFLILHTIAIGVSRFGGLMLWRHRAQWNLQQADPEIGVAEKRFLHRQYRRRMQSSSMVAILGLLLNASNEHLVDWRQAPAGFFVYVTVMLVLILWIVALAFADFLAAQVTHRMALARLQEHQRKLEESLSELRHNK